LCAGHDAGIAHRRGARRYGRRIAKADDPADYWQKIWMVGGSGIVLALFAIALTIRLIVRGAD